MIDRLLARRSIRIALWTGYFAPMLVISVIAAKIAFRVLF